MASGDESWKAISSEARQRRDNAIPSEWCIPADKLPPQDQLHVTAFPASCGLLTPHELEITDTFAVDIVKKIGDGIWNSEDVTRAFCKRAAIAQQLTNCLSVIMFDDALARAKQLDAEYSKTGNTTGPLHGLPVSIKDNFNIPGYPSSVGFCTWALEPMQQQSTIITILLELGAIPFVKTNVPTAMMMPETTNNVYGRTVNPLNRATTSGGSSGGESALIALHGSPLGVGTDIGGSLRIPASCTGIFTLRPSFGRFPQFDARTGLAGQEAVASVHGPMARCVADLRLYAENVVGWRPWRRDPKCVPLSWREVEGLARVKVGVLWDNGIVHPTPPVARALKEVVEDLRQKGYEVVDWPMDDHAEAAELLMKFFLADGGKSTQKLLGETGEPWFDYMKAYASAKEAGVYEMWQWQKARTALQKRMLDRFEESGVDVILGPATPYVSPKNGEFETVGYTGIYNIVDWSSVSFPTGVAVDQEKDVIESALKSFGEADSRAQKQYDAELLHGMPVSLQLTSRRLEEEKLLLITEKILQDLQT